MWVMGFLATLAKLLIMTVMFFMISIFIVILTLMGLVVGDGRRVLIIVLLSISVIVLSLVFVIMLIDFYYSAVRYVVNLVYLL